MKRVSLVSMKENHKGTVVEFVSGHALEQRCMALGIYRGKEITKVSQCALRGPVMIKVGRSVIALGRTMAHKIMLDVSD